MDILAIEQRVQEGRPLLRGLYGVVYFLTDLTDGAIAFFHGSLAQVFSLVTQEIVPITVVLYLALLFYAGNFYMHGP